MTEVIIVGGGPVGITMSIALSTLGVSNMVLERESRPYQLPRAIVMDAEVHRTLLRHGLDDDLRECLTPMVAADFVDANGTRLMGIDLAEVQLFGLPAVSRHYQPQLEAVLRAAAVRRGAQLRTGSTVTSIDDEGDAVRVKSSDGADLRAKWVVGCDGAASFVRKSVGLSLDDLGFDQDWLVVDLLVPDKAVSGLPDVTRQVCDPRRPTTLVSGHGNYYRFEFQIQPGEEPADMRTEERVWQLLEPWISPKHASLVRTATYRFHAVVANSLRNGRVFIAGDAAHQMPPFMGQGLNSGMRDAFNLAWKLAYVTRGISGNNLLDTYSAERIPHARGTVAQSVETGRLIDQLAGRTSHGVSTSAGYGGSRRSLAFSTGVVDGDGAGVGEPFAALHTLPSGSIDTFVVVAHAPVELPTSALPVAMHVVPRSQLLSGAVVVVRPDGYVAAVCETSDVTAVLGRLARAASCAEV